MSNHDKIIVARQLYRRFKNRDTSGYESPAKMVNAILKYVKEAGASLAALEPETSEEQVINTLAGCSIEEMAAQIAAMGKYEAFSRAVAKVATEALQQAETIGHQARTLRLEKKMRQLSAEITEPEKLIREQASLMAGYERESATHSKSLALKHAAFVTRMAEALYPGVDADKKEIGFASRILANAAKKVMHGEDVVADAASADESVRQALQATSKHTVLGILKQRLNSESKSR